MTDVQINSRTSRGGATIRCDFGTDDPDIAQMLTLMQNLSPYDELRLEMEAMLYSQLARHAWQEAALARQRRLAKERAQRRAADRKAKPKETPDA